MSHDLDVSLHKVNYLVSCQIVTMGFAVLFWKPISARYGRRPILIISTLMACTCNIGAAKCTTYTSLTTVRVVGAWFIAPAAALGTGVVQEMFLAHERGGKMGVWA
jgi:predicted MFS family arabinose efflux permease